MLELLKQDGFVEMLICLGLGGAYLGMLCGRRIRRVRRERKREGVGVPPFRMGDFNNCSEKE